jgi:thiosulfate dehydrogenase
MRRALIGVMSCALVACAPRTSAERGEVLFSDPSASRSSLNAASCATCHAPGDVPADTIVAGGSLRGVIGRPSYWGGTVLDPREAVNACLYYFMRASTREELGVDDPRGEDLLAYLETLGTDASSDAAFTVPATLPTTLPTGDGARGAIVYAHACHVCHGDIHTGAGRPSVLAPMIPDATLAEHGTFARTVAIAKVRHGGFYGIGGAMPPFSLETLDDAALADVLAYLAL